MGSSAQVKVYQPEEGRYKVILEGEKLGQLIGRRGEEQHVPRPCQFFALTGPLSGRRPRSRGGWGPCPWSRKLGQLIGRRGETLDAIQQLTNYSINRGGEKRGQERCGSHGARRRSWAPG